MRDRENKKTSKYICGILVIAMITGILYLTFQTPEQTTALSERVRLLLKNMGWEMTSKEIRSNVHIPLFFFLGIAVFIYGHTMKWKWYVSLMFAIGVALIDEGIKIIIPTREFDVKDLAKDFIGIGISGLLLTFIRLLFKKRF